MKRIARYTPALLVVLMLATAGWSVTAELLRLDVQPQSKLRVEGTSSVHDWACEVKAFTGSIEGGTAAQPTSVLEALSHVQVTVPVAALECKNGTMNKKAQEALKADENPAIQYVMQSAEVQAEGTDGWTTMKATGQLRIAGVEKPMTMTVKGRRNDDGTFRFTGSTPLLMSDFGMKAPTAMLGAMKTGDRVVVHFDVLAR